MYPSPDPLECIRVKYSGRHVLNRLVLYEPAVVNLFFIIYASSNGSDDNRAFAARPHRVQSIRTDSANSVEFREIRPRMYYLDNVTENANTITSVIAAKQTVINEVLFCLSILKNL